ncbi:MAG: hypothetical protein ACXAEE_00535 [Candidatus Thorarchaeota archaeon]
MTWRTSGYMGLFGHFDVVNGTDISFFICNETAFNDWKDGHDIAMYELQEDVTSGDYEFLSHGAGGSAIRWYLVFDNTDSTSTTQTVNVDFHIDLTPPTIECNVEDNDVVSGTVEFVIIARDRFGVGSFDYSVYAASYPNSFDPIRQSVYYFENDSFSFRLNTETMENGSYYISITARDLSRNERQRIIHFRVENAASGKVGLPTVPLFVAGSLLGIVGLVIVLRRRKPTWNLTNRLRIRGTSLVAELRRRSPHQASKGEEKTISIKAPADIRVVCGIVGALAVLAPIYLIIQPHEFGIDMTLEAMLWSFWPNWGFAFEFVIFIGSWPFTGWRLAFVYQMYRYYEGRSSRRMTVGLAIFAEFLYDVVNYLMFGVFMVGYWGPLFFIPTPFMLFSAMVFMWFAPYPVPKSAFDDHAEPDKWWKEDIAVENG